MAEKCCGPPRAERPSNTSQLFVADFIDDRNPDVGGLEVSRTASLETGLEPNSGILIHECERCHSLHVQPLRSWILENYLADLDDADTSTRPLARDELHRLARLGHLLSSERFMVEGIKPGSCPPSPRLRWRIMERARVRRTTPRITSTKQEYIAVVRRRERDEVSARQPDGR